MHPSCVMVQRTISGTWSGKSAYGELATFRRLERMAASPPLAVIGLNANGIPAFDPLRKIGSEFSMTGVDPLRPFGRAVTPEFNPL